jgi:arylsulfatase A-like enzyme
LGVWENALFILLSSHGSELGDHGGWLHDQSVYEESVRVPLLIRLPRGQLGGRRIRESVSLIDVLPTIADYLKAPTLAERFRAASLLPLLKGRGTGWGDELRIVSVRMNQPPRQRPFAEQRGGPNIVLRQRDWKGIWNADVSSLELYNIAQDPGEQQDVSSENAELAARLRASASAWLADQRAPGAKSPPAQAGAIDDQTGSALRSLGYIDGYAEIVLRPVARSTHRAAPQRQERREQRPENARRRG